MESGTDIVLRCSVNEGTGPITYKFYKENGDRPFFQVTANDTQAFWRKQQASKEQEGQYYCTASNRASFAMRGSQSNTLTVRGEKAQPENPALGGTSAPGLRLNKTIPCRLFGCK